MSRRHFRELVQVLFHLSEGYTKVVVEITEGVGLADGGCWWDIPTKVIPPHLRCIGSRFYLVGECVHQMRATPLMTIDWQGRH